MRRLLSFGRCIGRRTTTARKCGLAIDSKELYTRPLDFEDGIVADDALANAHSTAVARDGTADLAAGRVLTLEAAHLSRLKTSLRTSAPSHQPGTRLPLALHRASPRRGPWPPCSFR